MARRTQTEEGRLPFHNDESSISFVSRYAAWSGFENIRTFLASANVDFQQFSRGDAGALGIIADITGVPIADLDRRFIRRIKESRGAWSIGGDILLPNDIQMTPLNVCPECVATDIEAAPGLIPKASAYGRLAWLIRHVRTCHVHCIRLVPIHHEYSHPLDFACQLNNTMLSLLCGPYPSIEELQARSNAFCKLDSAALGTIEHR